MARSSDRGRLLETVEQGPMDPHARIITLLLGCDSALVTVLDEQEQRFLGQEGMTEPAARQRATPLDRSLCRDVVTGGAPMRLDDLAADDRYAEHPARTDLDVQAYLGVPLRTPSGEVVGAVCGLHHEPMQWSERDAELLAAIRDLIQMELRPLLRSTSDRDRAEEVTLLLSTLRHELGGELAIVLGGIETAMLPGIDEDLRMRVLANARRDCRRVVSTLDALLRVDSRAPLQLRDVELSEAVQEVADSAASAHETERIEVAVEQVALVTEEVLLQHVVRNLVDNACKYSDGSVLISGGPSASGAWVSVSDDGPGIPDDVVIQLYEPFSRPRDDGGASGFGLGLYIVRRLCERLGARLSVQTNADGTTIRVTVPDRRQSPKPSKAASSSAGA